MGEDISVGDKLFYVPSDRNRWKGNSYEPVVAVRRKWMILENGARVERSTMLVEYNGFGSRDQVFRSEADYLARQERGNAWSAFRAASRDLYQPPDAFTTAEIWAIVAKLKSDSANKS